MAPINEKQTIAQALATTDQPDQPPLYSPVRETKPTANLNGLLPPLQTQGLPAGGSNSASSSATAINQNTNGPITAQPLAKSSPSTTTSPSTYESWNPADGSNKDGRPPWWNRWFCCGYGVGCVLCLCGSPTCWQERQKQVVDGQEGKEGEKRF